jgi:hypothetical protein
LEKIKFQWQIIPTEGSFIAWKKGADNSIIKIQIPAKSKRTCNIINRKCRAEYVKVLAIFKGEEKVKKVCGQRDEKTIYEVGKITYPDKYNDDFLEDCSNGIHFFITREEAEKW